jgi:hypothetical protein
MWDSYLCLSVMWDSYLCLSVMWDSYLCLSVMWDSYLCLKCNVRWSLLDINKSKETACSKKSYVSKRTRETIPHYT